MGLFSRGTAPKGDPMLNGAVEPPAQLDPGLARDSAVFDAMALRAQMDKIWEDAKERQRAIEKRRAEWVPRLKARRARP